MRAIVYEKYGSPDVLQLLEIDKPLAKDNEVLIKISASTVSTTDSIFRKGKPFISRSATGFSKPKNKIPGDVFSGEIETVGKDVTQFKKGDLVYGATGGSFGTHAEYICMSEKATMAIKPANLSHGESAAVSESGLTALPFLRDSANLKSGQEILINGASGSIGSMAVQLAKHFGAIVTGVCSTGNIDMVKALGADKVIDYSKEDFTKNNNTYDVIFDSVGKSSFSKSKNALKPQGIYLTTVLSAGIIVQMIKTSMGKGKKASITFTGIRSAAERVKDLIFLKELCEKETIRPLIDKTYALDQIVDAHRYVDKGHKRGHIVLSIAK